MGSIELTSSGTWKARYRDLQGRSRRKHFKDRRDAERFLQAMEVDRGRGLWLDPVASRMRFDEWVQEWERTVVHLRPSTADRYRRDLHLHLLPRFASMRLCDITPRHVRAWLADMTGAGVGASAVNRRFRVLRMLLGAAVASEVIARSPTKGVKPPPVPVREMAFLSPEEVRRLAEAMHPWFRTWVYFAAYTGLRWSEMLGVQRGDIDLGRARLRVERQVIEVQSRFVECGPLKTAASRRTVTLPPFLVDMLEVQLAERARPGMDGHVFVNTAGHTPHASSFTSQVWGGARRRAGLERVRWHDLRHTAVALAIEQGAHAKAIQERMGHASVKVTLDRYGHILPSIEQRLAGGLDDTYRRALGGHDEGTRTGAAEARLDW